MTMEQQQRRKKSLQSTDKFTTTNRR